VSAEARLRRADPDDRVVAEAAEIAPGECSPMVHPLFGSVAYKRALVATTVRKALALSVARARRLDDDQWSAVHGRGRPEDAAPGLRAGAGWPDWLQ
jgi:hypothetical protein